MSIDIKDVNKLCKLSMFKFDENEKQKIVGELNTIIDFVSHLQEVNTDGVVAMASTVSGASTPERADESIRNENRDDYLAVSPNSEMGFYVVPRVLE